MRNFLWAAVVAALLLCAAGCVSTNNHRGEGEQREAEAYEMTYKNERERADSLAAANVINHTRRMDLELKLDMQKLAEQAVKDPTTWTAMAISAETTRLQALHDQKIQAYNDAMAASAALRAKNEGTNLATARKIRDTLNKPGLPPPVSLTGDINASAGAAAAPVPLIKP